MSIDLEDAVDRLAEKALRIKDERDALYDALIIARDALKANEEISGTWELYQASPEMKAINAALAKAEGRS